MAFLVYTLMDTDTGNLIGTYATEREALSLVHGATAAFGTEYADDLVLGRENPEGQTTIIAAGQELAKRALSVVSAPGDALDDPSG